MAWAESHQAILFHPKTLALSSRMGWDLDQTIGKLHRFWWWCLDYAPDGDLGKHNDSVLAGAVGLNSADGGRFKAAMVESCWIDRDPYFRVHDWWDYAGRYLQIKYKNDPAKWRATREAYKGGGNNPPNNPPKAQNQPTNQPTNPEGPVVGELEKGTYDLINEFNIAANMGTRDNQQLSDCIRAYGIERTRKELRAAVAGRKARPVAYAAAVLARKAAESVPTVEQKPMSGMKVVKS